MRHVGELTTIVLVNLSRQPVTLALTLTEQLQGFEQILADSTYPMQITKSTALTLNGFGYRWFRRKVQNHSSTITPTSANTAGNWVEVSASTLSREAANLAPQ
ncbi:hypothetical protein ALP29_201005 [Pseudomonas syringae pv. avii]|uniref:Sucrose hydrolase-like C-terminal domain-containing protein n=1 Tax=Pseudomonas syringae pv. avii TaxID=663959 RepID=A0A3M5VLE4_PSESX|nr:hypothetical protein ALP43_200216 [Pseudomonas azotoformans]RMU59031.1 hypothetical protein ALP29_201005 [Pseudomonas syringae pv. avii]